MGLNLGTLFVNIKADSTDATKKVNQFSDTLKGVSGKVTSTGKALTLGVTTPLIGIGTAAVKTAVDFEKSASKVNTIADTSQVSLANLKMVLCHFQIQQGKVCLI